MNILKKLWTQLKKYCLTDYIIFISAAFTFVCYLFYCMGGTVFSDSGGIFVTAFIMLGTTLPIAFSSFLKKILKKAYPILKNVYCVLLSLYMISFLIFSAVVITQSEKPIKYDERQTVVLVCGCKVRDNNTPSTTLRYRLDKALGILEEKSDAICIVSGGQGADEMYTEASVMKNYLINKGIADDRILVEDKSRNTVENIDFSIKVMQENQIDQNCNLICVSTDIHTSRVAMIARERGFDPQIASSDSPYFYLKISSLVREFMSYAKYFIFG